MEPSTVIRHRHVHRICACARYRRQTIVSVVDCILTLSKQLTEKPMHIRKRFKYPMVNNDLALLKKMMRLLRRRIRKNARFSNINLELMLREAIVDIAECLTKPLSQNAAELIREAVTNASDQLEVSSCGCDFFNCSE